MRKSTNRTNNLLFTERISSNWTEALFLALMILFFLLFVWRMNTGNLDMLAAAFFIFFIFFFFYAMNYRTLVIDLTPESLRLKFGIFTWTEHLENIEECSLDEIPVVMRMGGAGIHFMLIRKRYRASFNFLEYPRIVIALKRKRGPVQDISFSTRRPDEILRVIRNAKTSNRRIETSSSN